MQFMLIFINRACYNLMFCYLKCKLLNSSLLSLFYSDVYLHSILNSLTEYVMFIMIHFIYRACYIHLNRVCYAIYSRCFFILLCLANLILVFIYIIFICCVHFNSVCYVFYVDAYLHSMFNSLTEYVMLLTVDVI